jgi:hypothetical protein
VPCDNFGIMVNDKLIYPGDSFSLPPIFTGSDPARMVLALPASAPWLKVDEALNYLTAVKPAKVFPTHNALLTKIGQDITYSWLRQTAAEINAEFIDLQPNEFLEI